MNSIRISQRLRYLVSSVICILNILGMFLVLFGAAAGAHVDLLLWPAVVLFTGGILLLAFFSAIRASQVGLSPAATAIAAILMCALGPAVPILVIYLTMKDEKNGNSASVPTSPWGQWLALLFTPWVILWAIKHMATGS
ncbi:hypothetical protein MTYP_02028 [Methylophilaceae bacterium]|nr:hypothetical protein MTYP_02028 [Methylophilaceae bacterium]